MEKLAKKLSEEAGKSGGLSDEQQKVIAYGLGALLQMLLLLVLTVIFSSAFRCFYEAITVFLAVGILKGGTGGAHAGTETGCTVISMASIIILSLTARYVIPAVEGAAAPYAIAVLISFATGGYAVYRLAPVDSPNKPIKRPEKIRRLRRRCFVTLAVYFIFCAALITAAAVFGGKLTRCLNVSCAMCLAVLWQAAMLTGTAQKWILTITSRQKS